MARVRKPLFGLAVLLLAALPASHPVRAIEAVDVAIDAPNIDIASFLAFLETDQKSVTIERPDKHPRQQGIPYPSGVGPWLEILLVLCRLQEFRKRTTHCHCRHSRNKLRGIRHPVAKDRRATTSSQRQMSARLLSLPKTHLMATPSHSRWRPDKPGLWRWKPCGRGSPTSNCGATTRSVARQDYFAFFRGALLGITLLLTLALFALYGFRARAVFLAAGGFSLASVAFIALESGHLDGSSRLRRRPPLWPARSARLHRRPHGVACCWLFLGTHAELRRLSPFAANAVLLLGGLALGIPVYGFVEPAIAAATARGLFALTAVAGFLCALVAVAPR